MLKFELFYILLVNKNLKTRAGGFVASSIADHKHAVVAPEMGLAPRSLFDISAYRALRRVILPLFVVLTGSTLVTSASYGQVAPAGSVIDLNGGTPVTTNSYTQYSTTVTPQTAGNYYVLFAFREDPNYFSFDDASFTASGSSTNLLANPGFEAGTVPSQRQSSLNLPVNWGIAYQTGAVPPAAGTVNTFNPHSGSYAWYDGSVGSFDGLYQVISLQASQTYALSFWLTTPNNFVTGASGGGGIEVAAYVGSCGASISACATSLGTGFTVETPPATPTVPTTPTTIAVTGGDIAANVYSLGSAAAQATTVQFAGGTLRMTGGNFPNNIVPVPVALSSLGGTVDTSTGNGGFSGTVSGPGSLTVEGGGTFILSGTNTYAGGTIIEQSRVGVTNANSLGTGSVTFAGGALVAENEGVTISNNAVLSQNSVIDSQTFTLAYAGAFTGTGSLAKQGAGTLVLSGANSFSGSLLVNEGTLRDGSATGLSPNSAVTVAAGATLDVAGFATTIASLAGSGTLTNSGAAPVNLTAGGDGTSTTFSGTLQDGATALTLTKDGTGALTLSGANTYSGGTFLDSGEIVVGSGTALGTGLLSMAGGTTLGFADSLTLANPIAFTVAADPTIDTGSNSVTLSGPVSGPGSLTKIGSGTLDLAATNPYTGDTIVAEGGLLVDGAIANSNVTVNSGAALGGRGTVGSLNLLSGAVLSPGAATPFSTLTITGNATLQSGSTYLVNVNAAGQSDRINVGGTAALNGATLAVNGVGSGIGPNTRFDILSAAGGITGQFGSVQGSSNLAFLAPALSYTGTDVTLGFSQRAAFTSIAATPNQRGTAAAIESLGPGNPLYNAVVIQDAAGARRAFQTASGETRASATTAAVTSTRVVNSIIFDRLWNLPLPQAGDALDALKQFEPHNLPALLQCYAPTTAPSTGLRQGAGYTVWGQAIGDFGRSGSDGNAAAVDRTLGGFVLGVDSRIDAKAFDNWRVGVAGGYTNTEFSVKSGGGSGTFENVFGTLYAGARYGAVTLRFGGTYGGTSTNASRSVVFPGYFESERSSSGGETGQAFGEIGYRFTTSTAVIEPTFNGAITHTHQDAYREKGGAAALVGAAQDVDVGSTVLGVRGELLPFGTLPLVARLFLGWQHTYGDINPAATLAFASGGVAFNSYGAPIDRNAVVGEVGLDWRASTALSLGLTYSGQAGERTTDNAVKGRVEYRF
ncbi:autotransporter outer membrane beta-barrel domain-containing protein [Lichenifustis flavocetrariae]|uniref:Autotransporter domain-containing protein n=1 Tax=Lichenifustis flavocetrariae TaxID=2949735 RepID=A0AA41YS75_9HYPH|nr:autotransporter domain-containing protein [Lichenifustis flavocetrariae]MCW6507581.1 autotransporter domain-containing protein [Lichenifustis flavocetrariae]